MFKGIIDTTFREGQQSPLLFDVYKYKFSLTEKKNLFKGLLELGVRRFEFFSPIVSEEEAKHFRILKAFAEELGFDNVLFFAHSRVRKEDVYRALEAGFDGINLYLNLGRLGKLSYSNSLKSLIKDAVFFIRNLRKKHPHLYLRFSSEDVFRADLGRIFFVYDQVYPYINTFGLPDTVGIADPDTVRKVIKKFRKRYPKADLEVHFHNDRGFSVINALEAVKAGTAYVNTTVWGIGERSGITSITALLLNLYLENSEWVKDYNLSVCYPLNVVMASILGIQVPYNDPVSLTNRTHIAGVHQKAVLNERRVYEGIDLARFGVSKSGFLLGPLTGINLVYYFLKEIRGYKINREDAREIVSEFRKSFDKYEIKDPEKVLMIIADAKGFGRRNIPRHTEERRLELL